MTQQENQQPTYHDRKLRGKRGAVFIVGVPRSGTTLLSTILSRHSLVDISPETHFLAHDWRINQNLDLSDSNCRIQFINSFIYGSWFSSLNIEAEDLRNKFMYDEQTTFKSIFEFLLKTHADDNGKKIFGEKTPGHYEHVDVLLNWFPDSRIIFMTRDPRAVAASTIDTPFGTTFANFHARRWLRAHSIMKGFLIDQRILPMKYEDLVANPRPSLERLCKFLEVDFEPDMVAPSEEKISEEEEDWQNTHHARARGSIDSTSLSKWRTQLSSGQVRAVEQICLSEMEEQGYQPTTRSFSLLDRVKLAVAIIFCRLVLGTRRHFRIWVDAF